MQGIVKPTPGPGRGASVGVLSMGHLSSKGYTLLIQAMVEKHFGSRRHVLYARQQRRERMAF